MSANPLNQNIIVDTAANLNDLGTTGKPKPVDGQIVRVTGGDPFDLLYSASGRTGITPDNVFYISGFDSDDYWEVIDKTFVHIDRLGAVGDGSTDDSAILQTAFDSGASRVKLGPKTYKIDSEVTVPATSTVTLQGVPGKSVLLGVNTANKDCIRVIAGAKFTCREVKFQSHYRAIEVGDQTNHDTVIVENCEFDDVHCGVGDVFATAGVNSIKLFRVNHCVFTNVTRLGIQLGYEDDQYVGLFEARGNLVDGLVSTSGTAIGISCIKFGSQGVNPVSSHCVIDGNTVRNISGTQTSTWDAIFAEAYSVQVSNNHCENIDSDTGGGSCIYVAGTNATISNNTCKNLPGSLLGSAFVCKARNGILTNNHADDFREYGFRVNGTQRITATSNTCENMDKAAFTCSALNARVLLSNNRFRVDGADPLVGAVYLTDFDQAILIGNIIDSDSGSHFRFRGLTVSPTLIKCEGNVFIGDQDGDEASISGQPTQLIDQFVINNNSTTRKYMVALDSASTLPAKIMMANNTGYTRRLAENMPLNLMEVKRANNQWERSHSGVTTARNIGTDLTECFQAGDTLRAMGDNNFAWFALIRPYFLSITQETHILSQWFDTTNDREFSLRFNQSTWEPKVWISSDGTSLGSIELNHTVPLRDNQWRNWYGIFFYHDADNDQIGIWHENIEVTAAYAAGIHADGTHGLAIGRNNSSGGATTGRFDIAMAVHLRDPKLSWEECYKLLNNENQGTRYSDLTSSDLNSLGVSHWWQFDEKNDTDNAIDIHAGMTVNAVNTPGIVNGPTKDYSIGGRYRYSITPEEFGAVGDGITDDTLAMQAFASAKASRYTADNTYLVTDTLTFDTPNSYINGSAEIIVATDWADKSLMRINADNITFDGWKLTETAASPINTNKGTASNIGLAINGSDVSVSNVAIDGFGFGVVCRGTTGDHPRCRLTNMVVTNAYSWGVEIDGVTDCTLDKVTSNSNGLDGIKIQNDYTRYADGLEIINCIGKDNGRRDTNAGGAESTNGNGIDLFDGGFRARIIGGTFSENYGSGINNKGTGSATTDHTQVKIIGVNCTSALATSAGNPHGIELGSSGNDGASNTSIIGCNLSDNAGYGVALQGGYGYSVSDCDVFGNGAGGIHIQGTVYEARITNNRVFANTTYGILVGSTDANTFEVTRHVITGNVISGIYQEDFVGLDPDEQTGSAVTTRGIYLFSDQAGVTFRNNSIMNCVDTGGGVWLEGNCIFDNNFISTGVTAGIGVWSGTSQITNNHIEEITLADTSRGMIYIAGAATDVFISSNRLVQSSGVGGADAIKIVSGATGIIDERPGSENTLTGSITKIQNDSINVIILQDVYYATTAQLEDITHIVNTSDDKKAGFERWNTTTGRPVWATGPSISDPWVDNLGATVHTPV